MTTERPYAVVYFLEEDDELTAVVPCSWLIGLNRAYWPAVNQKRLGKMVQDQIEPEDSWPHYPCRVLKRYGDILTARQKAKEAELCSDLPTDAETRSKIPPKRLVEEENLTQSFTKKKRPSPETPVPPPLETEALESNDNLTTFRLRHAQLTTPGHFSNPAASTSNGVFRPKRLVEREDLNESCTKKKRPSPETRVPPPLETEALESNGPAPKSAASTPLRPALHPINFFKSIEEVSAVVQQHGYQPFTIDGIYCLLAIMNRRMANTDICIQNMERRVLRALNNVSSEERCTNLQWEPMRTREEFAALQRRIQDDNEYKTQLISYFASIGGKDMRDFVYRTIPRILNLDLQYTTNRSGKNNKQCFRQIELLLIAAARKCQFQFDDKGLEEVVRRFFKDVSDRHGGRERRRKAAVSSGNDSAAVTVRRGATAALSDTDSDV